MSSPEEHNRDLDLLEALQDAEQALEGRGNVRAAAKIRSTRDGIKAWSEICGSEPPADVVVEGAHEQMALDMLASSEALRETSALIAVAVLASADSTRAWLEAMLAHQLGREIPPYDVPMVERLREMARGAGLISEREEVPHA